MRVKKLILYFRTDRVLIEVQKPSVLWKTPLGKEDGVLQPRCHLALFHQYSRLRLTEDDNGIGRNSEGVLSPDQDGGLTEMAFNKPHLFKMPPLMSTSQILPLLKEKN